MQVEFRCNGVERGNQYDLFSTEFVMNIEKADALALVADLQLALYKLDRGEIDE